jgi:hypothetical protein
MGEQVDVNARVVFSPCTILNDAVKSVENVCNFEAPPSSFTRTASIDQIFLAGKTKLVDES